MANFDLKFLCCFGSNHSIQVQHLNQLDEEFNENWISIQIFNPKGTIESVIALDKSTAIKFAKTLRTEINKITESEVNND